MIKRLKDEPIIISTSIVNGMIEGMVENICAVYDPHHKIENDFSDIPCKEGTYVVDDLLGILIKLVVIRGIEDDKLKKLLINI